MRYRFTQRQFFSWLRKAKGKAEVCNGKNCLMSQFLPTAGVNVFHVNRDSYEVRRQEFLFQPNLTRHPLPRWARRVIAKFDKAGRERRIEELSMRQSRRLFAKQMRELA